MSASMIVVQIAGAVVMLLWGITMVRTGIIRAYGGLMRNKIGVAINNRVSAFSIGLGVTTLLQSSTATALIVSSLAAKGLITTAPALAIMLGADVGTTLAAQLLSIDIIGLSPILFIVGYLMYNKVGAYITRQQGRVLFGLGLILLALSMVSSASIPLRESELLVVVLDSLENETMLILLISALITWVTHSSLAMVLFVTTLVSANAVSLQMAMIMVLGANLGGSLPPIMATMNTGALGLRVTVGNALFKLIGCVLILPFIDVVTIYLLSLDADASRTIVNFHSAFNIGIAVVFIWLTKLFSSILDNIIPSDRDQHDPAVPQYLEQSVVEIPNLALANASRELFRLGEIVESMVAQVRHGIVESDLTCLDIIDSSHTTVITLHEQIKRYVTELSRSELSPEESERVPYIFNATTNLEHISDIVANIAADNRKRILATLKFSNEGTTELISMCDLVESNLKVAMLSIMHHDDTLSKRVHESRDTFNTLEASSRNSHVHRMRDGRTDSIETSGLHIHILRDLSRINGHIIAAISTH